MVGSPTWLGSQRVPRQGQPAASGPAPPVLTGCGPFFTHDVLLISPWGGGMWQIPPTWASGGSGPGALGQAAGREAHCLFLEPQPLWHPGVWPMKRVLGVTLGVSGAVAAAVTHWGRREGGAEMWARVSSGSLPPLPAAGSAPGCEAEKRGPAQGGREGGQRTRWLRGAAEPLGGSLSLSLLVWLPPCLRGWLLSAGG